MIKVGNQYSIIGVGENIQLLKEITDQEEHRATYYKYNNKIEQMIQPSDIVTNYLKNQRIEKPKQKVIINLHEHIQGTA